MEQVGVNPIWIELLAYHLAEGQVFTHEQVEAWLSTRLPKMGPTMRRVVKDALAIAYYQSQTTYPVVSLLLCDDASQFNALTSELALCWVHEFRHYKKLLPSFTSHCTLLEEFGTQFWQFYHDLLDYSLWVSSCMRLLVQAPLTPFVGRKEVFHPVFLPRIIEMIRFPVTIQNV